MSITFEIADKKDIDELIRLRIAYMIADFGSVSDYERECMERQLPDYFNRKLGTELIAFVARDGEHICADVLLHIIESPSSSLLPNGYYGKVLGVYTEPEYRGQGICTKLMENLVEYGRKKELGRIDLGATEDGYPVYKRVGFKDKASKYTDMTIRF